ncbi:MAG: beta-lactamase family protein [Ignavibacteriaceae bacterium]|nr:beta-lactamase family protein [Ignavibacteriaceae bacterium]
MKKILIPFVVLVLLTVFGFSGKDTTNKKNNIKPFNQENVSPDFSNVDSIVLNGINDTAFPGAVVLISKDGKIFYERAYGHFTYEKNSNPVKTTTMFDLASLTKVIATTNAVMICVDRGLFSLDDKVVKYIPEFGANGKDIVTIKNLMMHNAGLIAWKPFFKTDIKTADELLNYIYNSELKYEPGTKTVYSDWGLITVGKIIERVTGNTLDEFCSKEIFKPLGMTRTMFNPPAELKNEIMPTELDNYWRHRLVQGTVHDETSDMLGGVAGHAGLFSTAGDIAKISQMLLQKGSYDGKQYIKPETVEMFIKRQSSKSSRAIGWDTKTKEASTAGTLFDLTSYGHTGFTGTSVWTDPTRKLFVVFLTNRVYPTRENSKLYQIRRRLHDAVINAIEPK